MTARDLNPNTNGYGCINHATPESEWITDGAMIAKKSILPANVVKQWTHPRRRQGSRNVPDGVLAEDMPRLDLLIGEITTYPEIPPDRRPPRARVVPNGVDWVTFDAPCFLALLKCADSAHLCKAGGNKAVFLKEGAVVAVLMGQMV